VNEHPYPSITIRTAPAPVGPPPPPTTAPRRFDDEAGIWLQWGYRRRAEMLAHRAAEMREGGQ